MVTHTFAATGDSIITRRVSKRTDKAFLDMVELIRGADSAFTNLEIVTPKEPWVPGFGPLGSNLGSPPFILDELKWMGFNLYSAANNHSVDYTFLGLVDTLDALKERDMVYAGAGMTLGEARRPGYLDSPAGRVGLVACASTFDVGAQAAASRPDIGGRPGLNPMRYQTEYVVDSQQLAALRKIDEALGTDVVTKRWRDVFANPNPEAYKFLEKDFVEGETPRVSTSPQESDLEGIAHWISEARRQSDLVVATIHAHEGQNGDLNTQDIADFIVPMARHWIDAGADVFVGHGPHTLRGMEIYKGKPIFYSLGNFFCTSATNPRYGSESYEQHGLPPSATPADLRDATSKNEDGSSKHMDADPQYWRTVIPMCRFEGRELIDIELHPVELGFDLPDPQRGIPVLADNEDGAIILKDLQSLSAPFGTELKIEPSGDRVIGRVLLN
jgi:poly-gamma-glutamate synthesis protein (capsule biosynthesis protein)